jgi:PilZ domain-containing protein
MDLHQGPLISERRYPRVDQELPLLFRVLLPEKEKEWISTETKILGGGGISVTSTLSFPVGTFLHAKLNYYARVIEFTGEIVWTENGIIDGILQNRYGISFTQISQDSLLAIHDIIDQFKCRPIQTGPRRA